MLLYALGFWALSSLVLAQITVNTPSHVVQCQPVLLTWSGGTAPYYVTAIPSGQLVVAVSPLESISSGTSDTWVTWTVALPAWSELAIVVKDATGIVSFSAPFFVQPGSVSSCPSTTTPSTSVSQSTTSTTGGLVAPDSPSSGSNKSNSKTVAIAVGIVAGLLAIAVAVLIYLLVRRNRRRRDHLFDVDPSPVDQHGGGIVGGRLGMEVPHMYHAASAIVPFVPSSAAAGGQAIDGSSKVEQPWNESSQSDISPPYLTSSSQPQQPRQSSSNVASESRSDLGNPLERASFSSQPPHPQRVGGRGLVSPEKSALPGLPPGASPPIPGGMEGVGRVATPEAASMYRQVQSPPPQYEG
ncbi:hypothetical protein FRB95_008688 [Tulasnella sp. JGI-2019a]|nr:hypothetical protein FRB95_008688 [Tulasnella sp. JGI-2019a]